MSTKKLREWYTTAICGNDITSSCLYVSALAIVEVGQYAWVALLMVAVVLFSCLSAVQGKNSVIELMNLEESGLFFRF